jgi:hypothetical protein
MVYGRYNELVMGFEDQLRTGAPHPVPTLGLLSELPKHGQNSPDNKICEEWCEQNQHFWIVRTHTPLDICIPICA